MLGSPSSPPQKQRARTLVVLLLLLIPMVVRTTPPEEPPYHEFQVSGQLLRSGGGSLQNFTVAVALLEPSGEGPYILTDGGRPLAITRDTGLFVISARTHYLPDTLFVAVLIPGDDPVYGEPFTADGVQRMEHLGYGYPPPNASDGCCEDSQGPYERIEGYTYYFKDKTVTVP